MESPSVTKANKHVIIVFDRGVKHQKVSGSQQVIDMSTNTGTYFWVITASYVLQPLAQIPTHIEACRHRNYTSAAWEDFSKQTYF